LTFFVSLARWQLFLPLAKTRKTYINYKIDRLRNYFML